MVAVETSIDVGNILWILYDCLLHYNSLDGLCYTYIDLSLEPLPYVTGDDIPDMLVRILLQKKPTYALNTPCVVALQFIMVSNILLFLTKKRKKMTAILSV